MKVNLFQTIIALAIGALISYGFYIFNESDNSIILGLVDFLIFSTSLIFLLGTNFELITVKVNVKVASGIFFIAAMISSLLFTHLNFIASICVISYAIMYLVYILLLYFINKQKITPFFRSKIG
jgi:hypothetical protein